MTKTRIDFVISFSPEGALKRRQRSWCESWWSRWCAPRWSPRSGGFFKPEINCFWSFTYEGTLQEFDYENPPLGDNVLKIIKPIYKSLSSEELLTRCLGSETQNNESLNFLIWTFAPKHIHSRLWESKLVHKLIHLPWNETTPELSAQRFGYLTRQRRPELLDCKRETRKMLFSKSRKVSCMQQEWQIE